MSNDVARLTAQLEKACVIKEGIDAELAAKPDSFARQLQSRNFQFHIDDLKRQLDAAMMEESEGPTAKPANQ